MDKSSAHFFNFTIAFKSGTKELNSSISTAGSRCQVFVISDLVLLDVETSSTSYLRQIPNWFNLCRNVNATVKGVNIDFYNDFQIFWIFKIMKMIYLDCHWIDLFPVIKCCRDVLWRHMNLLYIYLTVVYLAGWNYHSSKLSKNSQNFIFSRQFTLKIHSFFMRSIGQKFRFNVIDRITLRKTVTKYYELRPHLTIFDQRLPVNKIKPYNKPSKI